MIDDRHSRLIGKAPFLSGYEIKLEFKWVITGKGEAYFLLGKGHKVKPMLYQNCAIDSMYDLFKEYPEILDEIAKARVALFEDAMLGYTPESELFDII